MRFSILVSLLVLGGCAATAPPLEVVPVEVEDLVAEDLAVGTEPVRVAPAPTIEDIESRVPEPTPKHLVRRRSVFPEADLVEWTLANGLTVAYRHSPESGGYRAALVTSGAPLDYLDGAGVSLDAPSRLVEVTERVRDAFSASRSAGAVGSPASSTLVVSGPIAWEWIEREVAVQLSQVGGGGAPAAPPGRRVAVDWDEWPAFLVARRVVLERAPQSRVTYDPSAERAVLEVGALEAAAAFRPVDDAEARRVRSQVAARWSSPDGVVDALATLYGLNGQFRPARPPAEAVGVGERIERTPPSRVNEILRRFASAAP